MALPCLAIVLLSLLGFMYYWFMPAESAPAGTTAAVGATEEDSCALANATTAAAKVLKTNTLLVGELAARVERLTGLVEKLQATVARNAETCNTGV